MAGFLLYRDTNRPKYFTLEHYQLVFLQAEEANRGV